MRKNILSLSIATLIGSLGLAGGAAAGTVEAGFPVAADATTYDGVTGAPITTATDLAISAGGVGHILMVPYFTVQNGNVTGISITNTDMKKGKAVKVRFRGASNSDDLFDFQVFMSPGDVWTAAITKGADGVARLTTADNSCTVPSAVKAAGGNAFVQTRLPSFYTAEQKAAETLEGYVEIFNMGDIPAKAINTTSIDFGKYLTTANPLYTAVKHVSGVAPCGKAFSDLVETGVDITNETEAYTMGIEAPSTGLSANYFIYNGPDSSSWSGEATAVKADGYGRIVFFPQFDTALPIADVDNYTADPSLRTQEGTAAGEVQNGNNAAYVPDASVIAASIAPAPVIPALMFDVPDLSTPYVKASALDAGLLVADAGKTDLYPLVQAYKLTAAIETTSITNDYVTNDGIVASTDWLFSMPTRRYNVAADYRGGDVSKIKAVYTNYDQLGQSLLNAGNFFASNNITLSNGQLCVNSGTDYHLFDREETTTEATGGAAISPGTPSDKSFRLCGEVNVLSFNAGSNLDPSALGAKLARSNIETGLPTRDGWAWFPTKAATASNALKTATGLPVIGSAFITMKNGSARPGVEGNYGVTWRHRTTAN